MQSIQFKLKEHTINTVHVYSYQRLSHIIHIDDRRPIETKCLALCNLPLRFYPAEKLSAVAV